MKRPALVGCVRCGAISVGVASCPRCPARVVFFAAPARDLSAPALAALAFVVGVLAWAVAR